MKKLLVLVVLATAGYAAYAFVLRSPAKRTCMRTADLCGLDPRGRETEQCLQMFDSLKKSNPSSVEQVTTCIADAKSCGEAAGCASGVALTIGTSFMKDFMSGLQKSIK
jgi:hypothetical protein